MFSDLTRLRRKDLESLDIIYDKRDQLAEWTWMWLRRAVLQGMVERDSVSLPARSQKCSLGPRGTDARGAA